MGHAVKTSLFNEYEAHTPEANTLCREIDNAIRPIIKRYYDDGFLLREIGQVAFSEISALISELILRNAVNRHRMKAWNSFGAIQPPPAEIGEVHDGDDGEEALT